MTRSKILVFAFVGYLVILLVVGFYNYDWNTKVDSAYLNGILTASSILFGLWAILIEREPKDERKKSLYKVVILVFFVCFLLLILSVTLIYFAGLNRLHSAMALWWCMVSFSFNAFMLAITLYYYEYKKML